MREEEGHESNLILEIKGMETEQDRAKRAATAKWVRAVNNLPERPYGKWGYVVCKNPHQVRALVEAWDG
jgi:type III restriction enzyme